ncbi:hypothetical protein EB796_014861 [Bugula neritina]|uniref:Uncharacterized protein n=1 Tax=Bugula neritina TaxID=10212 RepID=A0A7J7JMJ2_BUGNE|nr:hypothetical protein EB796_014861 [Bugula neritina]
MLETERLKERKEDEQLRDVMMRKGFELSPLPYTQVHEERYPHESDISAQDFLDSVLRDRIPALQVCSNTI